MGGRARTVLALAIGALLIGCGEAPKEQPAEAEAPATKGYASEYSQAERDQFVKICMEDDSRAHCECFMDYMAERVPYDEFFGEEDELSRRAILTMDEAIDACPS